MTAHKKPDQFTIHFYYYVEPELAWIATVCYKDHPLVVPLKMKKT